MRFTRTVLPWAVAAALLGAYAPGRAAPPANSFDPDSAWAGLAAQVGFGPRVPGSAAHRRCGDWIEARLRAAGATVSVDTFTYRDPDGKAWPLRNIVGHFGPDGDGRLLLVAHWDSRPWADQDPDPAGHDKPIPGADDGASGVAVLLETGRVLGSAELPRGVDLFFTDGEDLGRNGASGFCQGTRRFAARGLGRYRRGVVLDMVGDADLSLPVEVYSLQYAPEVVDWVWKRGTELAPEVFRREAGNAIFDDHIPLIQAGLPTVDLIDFEYPYWHTLRDDLNGVSRASLGAVGRVVLSLALRP